MVTNKTLKLTFFIFFIYGFMSDEIQRCYCKFYWNWMWVQWVETKRFYRKCLWAAPHNLQTAPCNCFTNTNNKLDQLIELRLNLPKFYICYLNYTAIFLYHPPTPASIYNIVIIYSKYWSHTYYIYRYYACMNNCCINKVWS